MPLGFPVMVEIPRHPCVLNFPLFCAAMGCFLHFGWLHKKGGVAHAP